MHIGNGNFEATREFLFVRKVGDANPDVAKLREDIADTLEAVLISLRDDVARIKSDRNLTGAGVTESLRAQIPHAAAKLAVITPHVEKLKRTVATREGLLIAPQTRHRIPEGVSADDSRAIEAEIRAAVRGMDPLDRRELYHNAARKGDSQTMRALELAPKSFPLLTAEDIAAGAELYAATIAPEDYGLLVEQRGLLRSIEGDIAGATRHISKMLMTDAPIAELATA